MSDHVADALYYRGLQAQWNARADAMESVCYLPFIPPKFKRNGQERLIRYVPFEYKQMRRRAGGYAAAARRAEILAVAEMVGQ